MKKFILGAVAAVVIGLGFTAADASAHWEVRTVQRWNPIRQVYIVTPQRVWVPDPVVVASPTVVEAAPAVVAAPPVVVTPAPAVIPAPVVVRSPIVVRPRLIFVRPFIWR
jgi:hypothetical protein